MPSLRTDCRDLQTMLQVKSRQSGPVTLWLKRDMLCRLKRIKRDNQCSTKECTDVVDNAAVESFLLESSVYAGRFVQPHLVSWYRQNFTLP
ncbi:unnamed protein product [Protopolystoma xenopodis]|uniref:Uncharacterized protein n=1 Tax=Protopolystoma xenopodis TaxID=117903 RepID=A0A448XDQ0_9PLAT|nr:unnamed protein product [Protopolystoma xenopodis]